jgi:hypothetical protein
MGAIENSEQRARISLLEQHIGTIVQVVIAGTLMWVGATVVEMRTQVVSLQEKVTFLSARSQAMDDNLIRRSDVDWNRKDQDAFERNLRDRLNNMDARHAANAAAIEELRRRLSSGGQR